MKTLRRKLAQAGRFGFRSRLWLASPGVFAQRRVAARGEAIGSPYVDGHVRLYHGTRRRPNANVAERRLAMPATTDYWVNDQQGDRLFVVTTLTNRGLSQMRGSAKFLSGDALDRYRAACYFVFYEPYEPYEK